MANSRKRAPLLWLAGGLLLSLSVLVVVFGGLTGRVLVTDAGSIPETADAVMTCVRTGDWDALQPLVSGNPDLEPITGEENTAENLIWNAYCQSLQWTYPEDFAVQDNHVTQQVAVTCLDIKGVTGIMREIMKGSAAEPEDREQALFAAAQQVLASNAPVMQREITLHFVRENGSWQLIADNALLALLSGFTSP